MGRTRDKLIVLVLPLAIFSSTKCIFPRILSTVYVYFSWFLIKLMKIKNYYVSITCIKVKRKHSRFTSLTPYTDSHTFLYSYSMKRHHFLIEFMCESIQKVRVMCIAMRQQIIQPFHFERIKKFVTLNVEEMLHLCIISGL